MVSQWVAGNLVARGRAWCSGQESKDKWVWRHCPRQMPTKLGGKMLSGMLSQAGGGRKRFLSSELGTHWCACSLAAGGQLVPTTPFPCSPQYPVSAPRVGGISSGTAVAGSRSFARVRVLFALLSWACLYLRNEPGDSRCWGSWIQPLDLYWVLRSQDQAVPGGFDISMAPSAGHGLRRF